MMNGQACEFDIPVAGIQRLKRHGRQQYARRVHVGVPVALHGRVDAGQCDSGGCKYGSFGGLAALTNGCLFSIHDADDTQLIDLLDGEPLKANEDWGALAGADNVAQAASGDDSFPVRFTMAKSGEEMTLSPGQIVKFTVRDDLRNLTKFRIMVQGHYHTI